MAGRRPSALNRSPLSSGENTQVAVPKLNKDPIWSLQPWPVTVTFAGREFEIPALSAADWLAYLMQPVPDLDGLINDLLPGAEDLLYELELDPDKLYEACLELIAMVSARPWWVALRQISVAIDSWSILGAELALKQIDASRISLALWLDALLIVTLQSMDPKDTTMFVMKLEAAPAGVFQDKSQEIEMSRDAFLHMVARG